MYWGISLSPCFVPDLVFYLKEISYKDALIIYRCYIARIGIPGVKMTVTVDAELANRHKEPNDGYKKYLGAKVEHMQSVLDRKKKI